MNKLLAILGIILVISMIGCQKKESQEPLPAANLPAVEDDSTASGDATGTETPGDMPNAEPEDMPEAVVDEMPAGTSTEPADVDISQEDLDNLKKDIEGMEYDDLNSIE